MLGGHLHVVGVPVLLRRCVGFSVGWFEVGVQRTLMTRWEGDSHLGNVWSPVYLMCFLQKPMKTRGRCVCVCYMVLHGHVHSTTKRTDTIRNRQLFSFDGRCIHPRIRIAIFFKGLYCLYQAIIVCYGFYFTLQNQVIQY